MPAVRIAIAAAVVAASLTVAASAGAGSGASAKSAWASRANATCLRWREKAAAAVPKSAGKPSTPAAMYGFMVRSRPIEAGLLRDLKAIGLPRPAGAAKALALLSADIGEIDAGISAHRAGQPQKVVRAFDVWQSDHRSGAAFSALGAKSCA
jgi:hypothetical protein